MEDLKSSVPVRPRPRVSTSQVSNVQAQSQQMQQLQRPATIEKKKEEYHNPKLLALSLLILACIGLCCFFLTPIYMEKLTVLGHSLNVKIKLLEFLAEKGSVKIASSLILVGYSLVGLNSLLNLWHNNKVSLKILFVLCNFVAVVASVMALICGFYLIFNLKYTPIALITIGILTAIVTLQSIAFLRCKVLKLNEKGNYINNKKLTITNLVLLLLFTVLIFVQLYICECTEHPEMRIIGWENGNPIYDTVWYKCFEVVLSSNLGVTLFFVLLGLLLYQIVNNIILLVSKYVQSSKYGFLSKIVCAILSVIYFIFSLYATLKINKYDTDYFGLTFIILACVVAAVIIIISIIQAIKSKNKKNY